MKRNPDLLRLILIALEEIPQAESRYAPEIVGFDQTVIAEHLNQLRDTGYITASAIRGLDDEVPEFMLVRMTAAGHDFLDSVRDPEIWSQTRKGADRLGSWTLTILAELAKGFIKAKARSLGLPL